jgi:hypothetical protein
MAEERFEDRRSVPRISVVCPVSLKGTAKTYQGLMRNISLEGAAIEASEELPGAELFTLEFVLPEGPELKPTCGIMWTIKREKVTLYGLKFVSLGLFGRMKLKSYMGKHLPPEAFAEKP